MPINQTYDTRGRLNVAIENRDYYDGAISDLKSQLSTETKPEDDLLFFTDNAIVTYLSNMKGYPIDITQTVHQNMEEMVKRYDKPIGEIRKEILSRPEQYAAIGKLSFKKDDYVVVLRGLNVTTTFKEGTL
jgi:pyruvate/2-oxoacid:ferredoxin oxidoreductase alpha subunit